MEADFPLEENSGFQPQEQTDADECYPSVHSWVTSSPFLADPQDWRDCRFEEKIEAP